MKLCELITEDRRGFLKLAIAGMAGAAAKTVHDAVSDKELPPKLKKDFENGYEAISEAVKNWNIVNDEVGEVIKKSKLAENAYYELGQNLRQAYTNLIYFASGFKDIELRTKEIRK